MYKETLSFKDKPEHFNIRVKKNAERFDVKSYLNKGEEVFPD